MALKKKALMVELDYKGEYIRYALTKKDFKERFPEVNVDLIAKGDSTTIRPLVHLWAKETNIGSREWMKFFTDMFYGLCDGDIKTGNRAYIDEGACSEELQIYV